MRRTILLADDSPTIQRLVTNTFADGDYDIVSVSNGEAAIRKFDEIQPHVVLADIYMPGKNGYEVCAYVRQHPQFGETPVVLLVGAFDAFDEEKARESGATSNITKPFEPQALVSLVESVLPESQSAPRAFVNVAPVAPPAVHDAVPPQLASPTIETYDELTPGVIEMAAPQPPPLHNAAPEPLPPPPPPPAPPEALETEAPQDDDLLGLENLFAEPIPTPSFVLSEQDIDRIADRVIQRISPQVIESLAWEIVPDLTERIVREELQRKR